MFVALLALIQFAAPGPWQHVSYNDTAVHAAIRYRIAHDAQYDGGPAGVSPSISVGTLTVTAHGRTYAYDLAKVLPIREHRIVLPERGGRQGCGAMDPLLRRGSYLVIESVYAEKGCRPAATFIDLRDGRLAVDAIYDSVAMHRNDAEPAVLHGTGAKIVRADLVPLPRLTYDADATAKTVPWTFVVVAGVDDTGHRRLVSYDRRNIYGSTITGSEAPIPALGERVSIGAIDDPNATFADATPRIRFDDASAPRLVVAPEDPALIDRRVRRNNWFTIADRHAYAGDLVKASDAFAQMLAYEDDPSFLKSETTLVQRCRALAASPAYAAMSTRERSAAWSRGCAEAKR